MNFALLAVFVSVGLYHLLLAAYRRNEVHDLSFGLFCLASSAYWFFLGGSRDALFSQPGLRWRIELLSLYASGTLFTLFLTHLLYGGRSRLVTVYSLSSLLAAATLLNVVVLNHGPPPPRGRPPHAGAGMTKDPVSAIHALTAAFPPAGHSRREARTAAKRLRP